MKRILITGATGFIGSALQHCLRAENVTIISQSRRPHESDDGIHWVQHDLIRDSWDQLSLPALDIVYHLAGQTSTYGARKDPIADLSANVLGLLNLLEYLRRQPSPPFVVLAGTVTEVGVPDELPIREDMPDQPITFYDISKLTAELYLKQYVREGWLKGCSLRFSNVFGRSTMGQQEDRGILDKVFQRAISGQGVTIYGDGSYLRDYIFIDDVVSALVAAPLNRERTSGRTFCVGSGHGVTIKDAFMKVVAIAETITGGHVTCEHVKPPADSSGIESRNAVIDSSAYRQATGWAAQYDLDQGLKAAYQSFTVHYS